MAIENRIVKIQKRNRALVGFDGDRIRRAILRAGKAVGGFATDYMPGLNDGVFETYGDDARIADCLADSVILCLNSEPHHLIANFPPTIEMIQDEVLHVLRSYGLQQTADAYACYRWSRHWLREGAITEDQFVGNALETERMRDSLKWNKRRRCDTVERLNHIVKAGNIKRLIEASLEVYEAELDRATTALFARIDGRNAARVVWIAGPTASGKTTTTVKITQRLEREGVRFLMLNLDDYFWPLVEHPTDWINDRNYETPEALDIQLLNSHLRALLDGRTIEKPVFSFKEGCHVGTKKVRLERDQILLLDCLHGLYPPMTEGIDASLQFRIFVDASNAQLEGNGESGRLVLNVDLRLLRRMLRDARHRNTPPLFTLLHWHYVRTSELYSIVPLMGLADVVINGGTAFDLPAIKGALTRSDTSFPTEEGLRGYPGFLDARVRFERLRQLLGSVREISLEALQGTELIPGDAVIREFIGGSTIQLPHNE